MNDLGQTFTIDVDPSMELENIMALLEAEVIILVVASGPSLCTDDHQQSGIPVQEQSIHYNGKELNNTKESMRNLGVEHNAMLLLRRKVNVGGRCVPTFHLISRALMQNVKVDRTRFRDDAFADPGEPSSHD